MRTSAFDGAPAATIASPALAGVAAAAWLHRRRARDSCRASCGSATSLATPARAVAPRVPAAAQRPRARVLGGARLAAGLGRLRPEPHGRFAAARRAPRPASRQPSARSRRSRVEAMASRLARAYRRQGVATLMRCTRMPRPWSPGRMYACCTGCAGRPTGCSSSASASSAASASSSTWPSTRCSCTPSASTTASPRCSPGWSPCQQLRAQPPLDVRRARRARALPGDPLPRRQPRRRGFQPAAADVLVEGAGIAKVPAQALAVAASMPLNFLGNKLWSFRARPERVPPRGPASRPRQLAGGPAGTYTLTSPLSEDSLCRRW